MSVLWYLLVGALYVVTRTYSCGVKVAFMAEWPLIINMIFTAMLFGAAMSWSARYPAKKLSPVHPSASMTGSRCAIVMVGPAVVYLAVYITGEIVLNVQTWYIECNGVADLGIDFYEWTLLTMGYDTPFWMMLLIWHTVSVGFVWTFGYVYRRTVWRNYFIVSLTIAYFAFILALVWGPPSDFNCIFGVNCSAGSNMATHTPFFETFSTADLGGCFYGPQLCTLKEQVGDNWQLPRKSNGCSFDKSRPGYVGPTYLIDGVEVVGPNNVWTNFFKAVVTGMLIACTFLMGLYHWATQRIHPNQKIHFPRL
jgi:hypothetical protein